MIKIEEIFHFFSKVCVITYLKRYNIWWQLSISIFPKQDNYFMIMNSQYGLYISISLRLFQLSYICNSFFFHIVSGPAFPLRYLEHGKQSQLPFNRVLVYVIRNSYACKTMVYCTIKLLECVSRASFRWAYPIEKLYITIEIRGREVRRSWRTFYKLSLTHKSHIIVDHYNYHLNHTNCEYLINKYTDNNVGKTGLACKGTIQDLKIRR